MIVVDQPPRKSGRRHARIAFALAHGQRRTVRVGNRIDERADETLLGQLPDIAVAEQPRVLGDELLPHDAGDAADDRKARGQPIVPGRHVTLPAAPHQREAAPHQKAAAGMLRVSPVRRAVEPRHDRLVAAIGHVEDETAVAAIEIERLQDPEVALILDVALSVARGPIEVDDPGIQGVRRIEFAEYRAVQPLIRADSTEFRAAEHGLLPLGHLDPHADAHVVLRPGIDRSLAWIFQTIQRGDSHEMGRLVKSAPGQFNKVCGASAASSANAAGFARPKSAPSRTFPLPRMSAQSTRRRATVRDARVLPKQSSGRQRA